MTVTPLPFLGITRLCPLLGITRLCRPQTRRGRARRRERRSRHRAGSAARPDDKADARRPHDHRTDHGSLGPGQWWLAALAREIEMPVAILFGWLKRGWVTGRQDARPPYRWIITADSAEVERLRALHQLPAGYHNRRRWTDDGTPIGTSKDQGARQS
jgi:hypothetical protein